MSKICIHKERRQAMHFWFCRMGVIPSMHCQKVVSTIGIHMFTVRAHCYVYLFTKLHLRQQLLLLLSFFFVLEK